MEFPTVHLNGTSKAALLAQHIDAIEHLRTARRKLAEAAPHSRDYYVKPNTYPQAVEEHHARLDMVQAVISDLEKIAERIAAQ